MKRPHSRIARRRLRFDTLEARKLLASGNDFYELKSDGDLYADDFFVSTADPVIPTIDASGRPLFDFRLNRPGDQTTDLIFAAGFEPGTRIQIDPAQSYQFAFIGYEGEGAFVVEAFNSSGQSLGQVAVPYKLPALEGLNFFKYTNVHAMIGPAGQCLPTETAWIDLVNPPQSPYTRFGFVEDYAFTIQSDRSVDQLKSPVTLRVNPTQTYRLSANAINHSSQSASTTAQLHSLGYIELDADRFVVEPVHTQKYGSSVDARLAVQLNPGDTTITLTSTEGWSNTSYDPSTRALAWYGYRDNLGTLFPDFTYTRNVARDVTDGLWSRGGISGNSITLNKPWAGPALPAGAALRNAVDGDAMVAALLDHSQLVSSMSATLQGQWTNGTPVAGQFSLGTKFLQLAATLNQSSVSVDERVSIRMQFDRNDSVTIISPTNQSRTVTLDVLANDGAAATQILSASPGKLGTVEIVSGGRQLVYRPQKFFIGTDAFTYDSVDSSGTRITRQVQIKSLGGNLDSNPTLKLALETAAATPSHYYPNVELSYRFVGVKDQTLSSSLIGRYNVQKQALRLDEIGFQAGSFSLQADGRFDYQPIPGAAYRFPFLSTTSNGSDRQPAIDFITIADSEFRRDQARLTEIGNAVEDLESVTKRYFIPSGLPLDTNGRPFLSWRVHILPYIGYQDLYDRFKQDEPWNSANNLPLLYEMPDIFRSADEGSGITSTRYQAIADSTYPSAFQLLLNNVDGKGDLLRYSRVIDGIENTLLVVQAGVDKAVPWTQNIDLPYDTGNPIATLGNVGTYFNAYFWRQKVRALPTDMSNAEFQGLVTPSLSDFADPAAFSRQSLSRAGFPGDGYALNERTQSEQMRQLLSGMFGYESAFKRFAPFTTGPNNTFSWRVWLLPYVGQQGLYSQFRFNETWDSPHNLSVAARMPDIYRSLGDAATTVTTRFRVLGGPNMAYGRADSLRLGPRIRDFTDGTSNSILIVEAGTDKAVPWTMPEVLPVDVANFWASLGTLPGDELLMGMADGSPLRASRSTANELLIGIATINQGDSNRATFQAGQRELLASTPFQTNNNLKYVGLAAQNFESTYRNLPTNIAGAINQLPTAANVGLSWRVAILPFLEENALYNQFHLNEPWDSPHNLSLLPMMPSVYQTSNRPDDYTTRVQRFSGPSTVDPNQKIHISQVTDGTSNTIFAGVVAPEKAVPWTKPDDIEFVGGDGWSVVGNTEFMAVVMVDGSVKALHYDKELGQAHWPNEYGDTSFEVMVTRNGGTLQAARLSTVVIDEDTPFAFNFGSSRPLLLEFADVGIAQAASRSDGYITGFGAQQRITIEAFDNRNGKRQTKLIIKTPSNDPASPPGILQTIDVIVVDRDQMPKISPIADVTVFEDATNTKVKLEGIAAGNRQHRAMTLSARSLDTSLIAGVSVDYQSGGNTATLSVNLVADQSGTGNVEVTVTDGGADGDLQTTNDNNVTQRTFAVTVRAVNDHPAVDPIADVVLPEDSGPQQTIVTGINSGSGETQPVRVTVSTNSLLVSLKSTTLTLTGSIATINWTPITNRFGQAVLLLRVEDGGLDENLATTSDNAFTITPLTITVNPQNDAPTINRPADQTVLEDTLELFVPLANIGAGPYELGEVLITLSVGDPTLVDRVTLTRLPGQTQGSLRIEPRSNQWGSTTIALRVEDGGADDNLATIADNLFTVAAFQLVIEPINDPPELNRIDGIYVDANSANVDVPLSGISAGDSEQQPLRITATADDPHLISELRVENSSGPTATLKFSTQGSSPGQTTIRVFVEDAGLDGNLTTKADNLTTTRQFLVVVNVPPVASDDRFRIVKNQPATLNVLDNDVDLGDTLTVIITQLPELHHGTLSFDADGKLQFAPALGFTGVAYFEYSAVDQLGRRSDIAHVTVGVANSSFQNPFNSLDVNSDGRVTPFDALLIINMLNDPNHPSSEANYTGSDDLDTNGDKAFSAIDALLVINELNSQP